MKMKKERKRGKEKSRVLFVKKNGMIYLV